MLHALECDDVSMNSYIRLRKPEGVAEDTARLMKTLTLVSETQKATVLANSKQLTNSQNPQYMGVFMHQDQTPKQREARRKLIHEIQER